MIQRNGQNIELSYSPDSSPVIGPSTSLNVLDKTQKFTHAVAEASNLIGQVCTNSDDISKVTSQFLYKVFEALISLL